MTSSERVGRVDRHRDGTVRARGFERDGELDGPWEWFRADGSLMRTGHFDRGRQVGEWTTYDRHGRPHKTTHMGR